VNSGIKFIAVSDFLKIGPAVGLSIDDNVLYRTLNRQDYERTDCLCFPIPGVGLDRHWERPWSSNSGNSAATRRVIFRSTIDSYHTASFKEKYK
jgi:hypothetical protein